VVLGDSFPVPEQTTGPIGTMCENREPRTKNRLSSPSPPVQSGWIHRHDSTFRAQRCIADDRARDPANNLTISGTVFWMLAAGRFGGSNLDAGDSRTGSTTTILSPMPPPTVLLQQTRIQMISMGMVFTMPVKVWGIPWGNCLL